MTNEISLINYGWIQNLALLSRDLIHSWQIGTEITIPLIVGDLSYLSKQYKQARLRNKNDYLVVIVEQS